MTTVSSNFIKKLINDGYIRPDINFVQFLVNNQNLTEKYLEMTSYVVYRYL